MGLRTLSEFRDGLNLALGEKRQGNERLDPWINDGQVELFAILDIAGRRICKQTTTIAAQERYALPSDIVAMLSLKDSTNKKRLLKTAIENFELLEDDRPGKPTHYARVDNVLHLYPKPNASFLIQLFYIKEPAVMALRTAVSELPSMYDRVIQMIALRNALIDLEQNERATFVFQAAQNKIRELPTEAWLESQNPSEGIQIATKLSDLQVDPRIGTDESSAGRWVL